MAANAANRCRAAKRRAPRTADARSCSVDNGRRELAWFSSSGCRTASMMPALDNPRGVALNTSTKRVFSRLVSSATAVVVIAQLGVEREAAAQPQACRDCNVILIAIDTLRADHLGAY